MFLKAFVVALVLVMSSPARAFEIQDISPLAITNSLALEVVRKDAEIVCPTSKLPSICEIEFQLAWDSFYLVGRVLSVSRIAHPGEESEAFTRHANRLHEQGWNLYLNALAEYSIPPLSTPEAVEKAEAEK